MTTLIQNEQKRQKIMARMREHLVPVLEHCRGGWVGLFLQGSQNYNLDYEGSDIDTKAIMLPSFSDFVLNAKPLSTTHIMENNEHVDFKDIRLMFDCIKKQCDYLKEVKRGCYSLKEARALMSTAIQSMTEDKKRYMDTVPVSINQHANEVLQKATVEILKRSFLKEIQGGE